jgi:hypothetical protein
MVIKAILKDIFLATQIPHCHAQAPSSVHMQSLGHLTKSCGLNIFLSFFFAVLELELRALARQMLYHSSHSASPFWC